jgi:adenosylhomocysteine nucleosidase
VDFARSGELAGKSVVLVANGPGPELAGRAAEIARENGNLERLVSTGYCGALDPALRAGDIFVAREVVSADRRFLAADLSVTGAATIGTLISTNRVATTAREKSELRATGADAVEMEAAGVAARALQWGIPFHAIRVVSDTAAESLPLDFNQMRDRQGRFRRARIVCEALLRPALLPKLMELQRKSATASVALGDFLANVRF